MKESKGNKRSLSQYYQRLWSHLLKKKAQASERTAQWKERGCCKWFCEILEIELRKERASPQMIHMKFSPEESEKLSLSHWPSLRKISIFRLCWCISAKTEHVNAAGARRAVAQFRFAGTVNVVVMLASRKLFFSSKTFPDEKWSTSRNYVFNATSPFRMTHSNSILIFIGAD